MVRVILVPFSSESSADSNGTTILTLIVQIFVVIIFFHFKRWTICLTTGRSQPFCSLQDLVHLLLLVETFRSTLVESR